MDKPNEFDKQQQDLVEFSGGAAGGEGGNEFAEVSVRDIKKANLGGDGLGWKEIIHYSIFGFGYSSAKGYPGSFKNAFLYGVFFAGLSQDPDTTTKLAAQILLVVTIVNQAFNWIVPPFVNMLLDKTRTKIGKYKPFAYVGALPFAVTLILMFTAPRLGYMGKILYLSAIGIMWTFSSCLLDAAQNITCVMSADGRERRKLVSTVSIVLAIANSTSLVLMAALKFLSNKWLHISDRYIYMIVAAMLSVVAFASLINAFARVKERISYTNERPKIGKTFFVGFQHRSYIVYHISGVLRSISSFNAHLPLLAAVATGDPANLIIFALPSGLGTFVGLIASTALLKRVEAKTIMIYSGFYTLLVSIGIFIVGVDSQVLFAILFFLFGVNYGVTNVVPNILKLDIYDLLELSTGQRLEGVSEIAPSLASKALGTVHAMILPYVLVWIGFKTPAESQSIYDANINNLAQVKRGLLLFICLIPGIIIAASMLIFFAYDLVGQKKKKMQDDLKSLRESYQTDKKE